MNDYATELQALTELDERHDELLVRIDELDKQVEKVLAEWTAVRTDREAGKQLK